MQNRKLRKKAAVRVYRERGPSRRFRGGDLDKRWIMFDHLNRVRGWTTMSCYVFDSGMCRLMTIATCEILGDDADSTEAPGLGALNNVMARYGVPNPWRLQRICSRRR